MKNVISVLETLQLESTQLSQRENERLRKMYAVINEEQSEIHDGMYNYMVLLKELQAIVTSLPI